MIYYTISSAHPADASDIIDRITLVYVLDQRLSCLKVELRALVLYEFSRAVSALDEQNIMIDPLGIQQDDSHSDIWLCGTCHPSVMFAKRPVKISRQLSTGRTDAR